MFIDSNTSHRDLLKTVEMEPDLAKWLDEKGIRVEFCDTEILRNMIIIWIIEGDETMNTKHEWN